MPTPDFTPVKDIVPPARKAVRASESIQSLAKGILTKADLKQLYTDMAQHPTLSTADPERVERALRGALNAHRSTNFLEGAERTAYNKNFAKDLLGHVERHYGRLVQEAKTVVKSTAPSNATAQTIAGMVRLKDGLTHVQERAKAPRFSESWSKMSGYDQFTVGLCALTGGSFLISGVQDIGRAHQMNLETGQKQWKASTLTIAAAEILFGIAATAFGVNYMRKGGGGAAFGR